MTLKLGQVKASSYYFTTKAAKSNHADSSCSAGRGLIFSTSMMALSRLRFFATKSALSAANAFVRDSEFCFNLKTLESGAVGDDWMMMNSRGTFW